MQRDFGDSSLLGGPWVVTSRALIMEAIRVASFRELRTLLKTTRTSK